MIINDYIIGSIITTLSLVLFDKYLPNKIKGKYYLSHAVINLLVVCLSYSDMISSYTNLQESINKKSNYLPTMLVYGLHFYHIISYFNKLRYDDWLHHILMVVVALPLGGMVNSGTLLNHSLFFLCGLPGLIDYIMLFLVRNKYINKMTEKKYNKFINLWLRAPGCIAHSVLTLVSFLKYKKNTATKFEYFAAMLTSLLVYWNGIYFMEQVVSDYKLNEIKLNEKKIDKTK
tara:strand:+ start:3318 stop:4010 length:693 start_codon:yes stop_codon:yes gene_type:complete